MITFGIQMKIRVANVTKYAPNMQESLRSQQFTQKHETFNNKEMIS